MTDAGIRVLEGIHSKLLIDEEWTSRWRRGFSWIGSRLRQSFDASEMFDDVDMSIGRVVARTLVVRNITANPDDVQRAVQALNRFAVGSAWVYDPVARSLNLVLACTVHDETAEHRATQIGDYAILQLIDGEQHASDLALKFAGEVAIAAHPIRGKRESPDDMLNLMNLVQERSGERSLFADVEEMETIVKWAESTQGVAFSAGASANGLALEVPFGPDDSSLIELKTEEAHPSVGNGLLVLTRFRGEMTADEATARLHELNAGALEPHSVMPLLGAWSSWQVGESWSLAFSTFVPNLMAKPGMALDATHAAVFRAVQFDRLCHPKLPQRRNVLEVVAKRMGIDLKKDTTPLRPALPVS